ncbi:MAG: FtsQ-type POTRA domain-containing protein [Clostridia bacterium]|nr:FtsQ-type POTRA domain-containing protein [Clostridia bacterium]
MKGNGRIIVFIAIIAVIVVFVILNMTVFTVKDVTVLNKVESQSIDKDAIITDSGIDTGDNIFLLSESKISSAIERNNPYVEVLSVERSFPNKVVIHVSMRTPLMSVHIQNSNLYALIDASLKILEIVDDHAALYEASTKVNGIEITDPIVGGVLYQSNDVNGRLADIAYVAEKERLEGSAFLNFFESVAFSGENGSVIYIKIRSGVTICLNGVNDTQTKLRYALEEYRALGEQSFKRSSGFIYFNESKGWDWSESDPYGE